MPQLFTPRSNGIARLLIAGALVLIIGGAVAGLMLNISPYNTGQHAVVSQPVPFSHRHHVGELDIRCGYCHTSFERSTFAGLPDTTTCMTCHSQLWTNADVLAPVRESLAQNKPLRWSRVHDLPDYVYFSHQAHVNNGVGCESCHGRVDQMPLTRQAKPLTMRWCLECHRDPGPHLRAEQQITTMGYPHSKAASQASAVQLLKEYNIRTERMTECVTCHR
ncbi:cytochrome c3 family protein [Halopseudomonas bauzanensis]|uniref:cytochrome c3 family protein n=1 Tax=Halopseudomonas bauzanensis TaxID=653930 RepID=UPI0035236B3C